LCVSGARRESGAEGVGRGQEARSPLPVVANFSHQRKIGELIMENRERRRAQRFDSSTELTFEAAQTSLTRIRQQLRCEVFFKLII
jgi:hypothetical protein